MKIGILTLGCRVNQYESDAIEEKLKSKGHTPVPFEKGCDAYIINTCTVTAESDSKCKKAIRRALRYGAPVAVIGCFVQGATDVSELNEVSYLSGNRNKGDVADYIDRIIVGERFDFRSDMKNAPYENLEISGRKFIKAYVKIEDGCNNFCSYCFVPYVRGRVRSRDEDSIIAEVKRLKDGGYREIILTGIETSAYGEDKSIKEPLCTLVERIQRECKVERLRFGSLNPSFFTEERVERLSEIYGVMPHFHLSVQSASDNVLSRMGRRYTSEDLYRAVGNIRRFFPEANLSCDMICGFPGESEADFEDSIRFIKEAKILHTHVFPFSAREGTRAAAMSDALSQTEKHCRARLMTAVADEVHDSVFRENVGKEHTVLVEFFKNGYTMGYTDNYIGLRFKGAPELQKGDTVRVKIEEGMDASRKN